MALNLFPTPDFIGYKLDQHYLEHYPFLIGIDEVGRGPLAGPVMACAILLDYSKPIPGLNDSKQLSPKQRESLFPLIVAHSIRIGIGYCDAQTIDKVNIYQATIIAMKQAITRTAIQQGILLIDGLSFPYPGFDSVKLIKGDTKSPAIMAASIVAKVLRDRLMDFYARQYPQYGFQNHKGYGTAKHFDALRQFGPCPLHRNSFEPIKSGFAK